MRQHRRCGEHDAANALVIRIGDRLYVVDSGVTRAMRSSLERVVRDMGPVSTATLVNTHAHVDHICNNDVLQMADAVQRRHYISTWA